MQGKRQGKFISTEEGDKKKFNKVIEVFQHYCAPRKNVLFKRHCFWNLQQMESKSIDVYLTRLKVKIDLCEYSKKGWLAAVHLEILRDRFVFGLLDDTLKERLLREKDLDLTKVVKIAQRQESSKQQIKEMASKQSQNVHAISHKKTKPPDTLIKCGCCGKRHEPKVSSIWQEV